MNPESLITEMEKIECDPKNLDAVVVFSVGAEQSEEQKRFGRILTKEERFTITKDAAHEVSRPSIFGVFIIMIV